MAALRRAADDYRRSVRVQLVYDVDDRASDPNLSRRRRDAIFAYLVSCGVPLTARNEFLFTAQLSDAGPGRNEGPGSRQITNLRSTGLATAGDTLPPRRHEVRNIVRWLSSGTLTKPALAALEAACASDQDAIPAPGLNLDAVMADCLVAVQNRDGAYARVPAEALAEFELLLSQCRLLRPGQSCAERVAIEYEYRAQPRAIFDPQPLTMVEKEETTFTAYLSYDRGKPAVSLPGVELGVPVGAVTPAPGSTKPKPGTTVIPISQSMCFELSAEPADFKIAEPRQVCAESLSGNMKFAPKWRVTPLHAGELGLYLKTTLIINRQRRDYQQQPWPLRITVTPRPPLWDRIDATIKRLTATVNLTVGLAESLKALFAVVASWAIWSLFRRTKRRRTRNKEN